MREEWVVLRERLTHVCCYFVFQAEDGIRDLVRSRGLGDVYKRQAQLEEQLDRPFAKQPTDDRERRNEGGSFEAEHALSLIHI